MCMSTKFNVGIDPFPKSEQVWTNWNTTKCRLLRYEVAMEITSAVLSNPMQMLRIIFQLVHTCLLLLHNGRRSVVDIVHVHVYVTLVWNHRFIHTDASIGVVDLSELLLYTV